MFAEFGDIVQERFFAQACNSAMEFGEGSLLITWGTARG
jgi:hypothetical protein